MIQSFDSDYYPNFYNFKETEQVKDVFKTFRESFTGTFIVNNNLTLESATEMVAKNGTDRVSLRIFLVKSRFSRKIY